MLRTKVAALSAVALLGGVLGACGGEEGVDPQTYVQEVCGSMQDWLDSIQQGGAELQELAGAQPAEAKEAISGFLNDAIDSTETLIGDIEETGPPAVDNGEDVHQTLIDGFEQAKSTFEDAAAQAEDLPTGSPQEFQSAAQELGTSITNAQSEIQQTFDQAEPSEELDQAFEEEESCNQLEI